MSKRRLAFEVFLPFYNVSKKNNRRFLELNINVFQNNTENKKNIKGIKCM